jgi:hypothetical protein
MMGSGVGAFRSKAMPMTVTIQVRFDRVIAPGEEEADTLVDAVMADESVLRRLWGADRVTVSQVLNEEDE